MTPAVPAPRRSLQSSFMPTTCSCQTSPGASLARFAARMTPASRFSQLSLTVPSGAISSAETHSFLTGVNSALTSSAPGLTQK